MKPPSGFIFEAAAVIEDTSVFFINSIVDRVKREIQFGYDTVVLWYKK